MSIKLSKRLQAIADFVEPGSAVADIGTDHGFLPVYLVQQGIASRVFASDISAGSLGAAKRSAEKYDVTDKVIFIHAPGLTGIGEDEIDTVVIAGVGGETIVGILEETPWTKNGKKLILQPQTKKEVLTDYLSENGYAISATEAVRDKHRDYLVLVAISNQL